MTDSAPVQRQQPDDELFAYEAGHALAMWTLGLAATQKAKRTDMAELNPDRWRTRI